jgi:hypothetical protein
MEETKSVPLVNLITIPALITLAITILRLVGELQHWPTPWFNPAAGGGGAIVGISWLPILFGPYFAWKLAGGGYRPSSLGKAVGYAALGLVVMFVGLAVFQVTLKHGSNAVLLAFLILLAAAFVPGLGWRSLGYTLLAYAFAARIPVLIVMFFAMRGNGGQGWGTHYDAAPPTPMFATASFASKFFDLAVLPQMTLWIAWTVVAGALLGSIVVALFRRQKHVAPVGV